jgi:hypothetical protein
MILRKSWRLKKQMPMPCLPIRGNGITLVIGEIY